MTAYYNENDTFAAQWLRNLIKKGLIADGDVDDRSIIDIEARDVKGYTQCHFFAGIGGWSYALRLAGWSDDRPVWTGSCPCQPFSAAGQRKALKDERHLWPEWFRLIKAAKPQTIFGEQVAAKMVVSKPWPKGTLEGGFFGATKAQLAAEFGGAWLDLVFSDLEAVDYTCGAAVLPACAVGAPHIRQRLWFVADANVAHKRAQRGRIETVEQNWPPKRVRFGTASGSRNDRMADPECRPAERRRYDLAGKAQEPKGQARQRQRLRDDTGSGVKSGSMAHAEHNGRRSDQPQRKTQGRETDGRPDELANANSARTRPPSEPQGRLQGKLSNRLRQPSKTRQLADTSGDRRKEFKQPPRMVEEKRNSGAAPQRPHDQPWSDLEWLPCTDGKARPTQSGIQPLLDGLSTSLARLRTIETSAWKEIATYGDASNKNSDEVLRMVREAVRAQESGKRQSIGMRRKLYAPTLLLDFLLCLEAVRNGTTNCSGFEKADEETRSRIMRGVWLHRKAGYSSCERQSDGRLAEQSTDALLSLSFLLARFAEAYRQTARNAHAVSDRTCKLRAAGNAIVPQVAAEFIKACAGLILT